MFFVLSNCEKQNNNSVPSEIREIGLEELYEQLKWETYQHNYLCSVTSDVVSKTQKLEKIEFIKVELELSKFSFDNDTIDFNFLFKYNQKYLQPDCFGYKHSYSYNYPELKKISWDEGGVTFFITNQIYNFKVDSNFIEYLKVNRNEANEWLFYYAKKKDYL